MAGAERGKHIRGRGFTWDGVPALPYKDEAERHRGVTRRALLGEAGEALGFVVRYFEVAPGGYTTLERHRHPHAVVVLRGRGTAMLDDAIVDVAPHDCVYVGPQTPHQFRAADDEPLGFLCVVDRQRDRPRPLEGPVTR